MATMAWPVSTLEYYIYIYTRTQVLAIITAIIAITPCSLWTHSTAQHSQYSNW